MTEAQKSRLGRWLREPLLHFLGLGFLLFAAFDLMRGGDAEDSIVIDDKVVAELAQRYASVWQRPPSPEEMRHQIDSYVREEILYRQGVALGLQNDDPIVRRRVEQKLGVIAEESGDAAPPTDAQLTAYLKAHADRFAAAPVVGFAQVYFDTSGPKGATEADVAVILDKLKAGADPKDFGESGLLPGMVEATPLDRIARDFGTEFAKTLPGLKRGEWVGPVRSGLGLHLVRIDDWQGGGLPPLDLVRGDVTRDYENDRRAAAADAYYRNLRKGYRVEITANLPDAAKPEGAR